MNKPSEFQMKVLKHMKDGGTMWVERSNRRDISLLSSTGEVIKIMKKTFDFLYWARYIDPNGHNIQGKDYYRVSEKGLKVLENVDVKLE